MSENDSEHIDPIEDPGEQGAPPAFTGLRINTSPKSLEGTVYSILQDDAKEEFSLLLDKKAAHLKLVIQTYEKTLDLLASTVLPVESKDRLLAHVDKLADLVAKESLSLHGGYNQLLFPDTLGESE